VERLFWSCWKGHSVSASQEAISAAISQQTQQWGVKYTLNFFDKNGSLSFSLSFEFAFSIKI
jgi:hypothetical protein